jgi:hypothetical protein
MGTKPFKSESKLTELSNFNSENGDVFEEFQEIKSCCGIEYIKLTKSISVVKLEKLIWENEFILNCQSIKAECRWANELLETIKVTKLPRTKYLLQMNEIKKVSESLIIPEN